MKNVQPEKCNENKRSLLEAIKSLEVTKNIPHFISQDTGGYNYPFFDEYAIEDVGFEFAPSPFVNYSNNMFTETLYFAKTKKDAKIPSKDVENGCYDVYACFDSDYMVIEPGEVVMVGTGIASAFSSGFRIGLRERGSTGSRGLSLRAGQIDSGYRGEWFVAINNTTNKPIIIAKHPEDFNEEKVTIYPYSKAIAQAALERVPQAHIIELPFESLKQIPSERGDGKLGSSEK